jgi:hypothetical protein
MARQTMELTGLGDIYSGDQWLRRTQYRLEVTSGPGHATIEGSIDISGMGEAVVLAGAEVLTLQLEDGRRLSFTLTSSAGRIKVHGGFQSAAG